MFSDSDLQSAVAAGIISSEAADALRNHVAGERSTPFVDEENFRLVSGFNDIFVSIAAIILLVAVWWIGNAMQSSAYDYTSALPKLRDNYYYSPDRFKGLGGLFCATTAWALAEYFTRKRHMAFPSIILLGAFVIGLAFGLAYFYFDWDYTHYGYLHFYDQDLMEAKYKAIFSTQERRQTLAFSVIGLIIAGATYLHWRRFHVPISIAACVAAFAALLLFGAFYLIGISTLNAAIPLTLIMIGGIAVFDFAMWWDMSDKKRETRRSDVAFWLHLLAAPMIAHPLFALIGISQGDEIGVGAVFAVLAVYIGFGLLALSIDRRALLVSALAYVLIALTALFQRFGVVELNVAVTALIIGSALLLLSAFWSALRKFIVDRLPTSLQSRLPATH
jgi:hypothetical protein